jgi:tetratricopeptide (TPR) repeat protein
MPVQPRSLKELFLEALAVALAERAAWLERECGADAELKCRVEMMLAAHDSPQTILDHLAPVAGLTPGADADFALGAVEAPPVAGCERATTVVAGRYKLIQEIGEGGMGTVWMAQQTEPVKRLVAVKLIKAGMDSRHVIARFEAERQALALMEHPNIARVLDAGTEEGRPFFVMELVKGVPITRYCDEHRLTPRERLELFLPVCQAIQHAHQKGIIHRDLKPANVLVAQYDGRPVPKVIDFGIAKAIGQQLTEQTLVTGFGAVVGTLEYMSPEQAELNQLDIDTRSDIYSLGVLLYELLTGSTPLSRKRLQEAAILEVLRLIREEEPPRPSTRLSTTEELPSVAASRGLEPRRLSGLVRGELDWLVMKALEKDRNRRYDSASALGADVERYLRDEPVLACPPGAGYRLRKLARRHRGKLAAAAVMLALLLAGTAVSTWQAVRATRAERETGDALALVTAEQGRTEAALAAETEAQGRTREALDALTDDVVKVLLARQPELAETEKAFLRKVLGFYETFTRQSGHSAEGRLLRAKGYFKVAYLHNLLGNPHEAVASYRQAEALLQRLADEFPGDPGHRHKLGSTEGNLGELLGDIGKPREAEECFRRALDLWKKLVEQFPGQAEYRLDLAHGYGDLGVLLGSEERFADAERAYRQALALEEKLVEEAGSGPECRRLLARTRSGMGQLLRKLERYPEAEKVLRQAVSAQEKVLQEFPAPRSRGELADSYLSLGIVLTERRKKTQAEGFLRRGLELRKKLHEDFPKVLLYRLRLAHGYHDLGYFLGRVGKPADAEKALRRALELKERLAAEHGAVAAYREELALTLVALGDLLKGQNKSEEAEKNYRRALPHLKRLVADSPGTASYRNQLVDALVKVSLLHGERREFGEAAGLLEEARSHLEAALKANRNHKVSRRYYRDCLRLQTRVYFDLSDHARLATAAEELARFAYDPAADAYLAACCLGTCVQLADRGDEVAEERRKELAGKYADRGLALLRQAVDRGFNDAERVENDPDLEPLRGREGFGELLAKMKRKELSLE